MVAPGPTQARIIQSVQHPMTKREGPVRFGPPWPISIFAVDAIFRRRDTAIIVGDSCELQCSWYEIYTYKILDFYTVLYV